MDRSDMIENRQRAQYLRSVTSVVLENLFRVGIAVEGGTYIRSFDTLGDEVPKLVLVLATPFARPTHDPCTVAGAAVP